ncbi:MAG TPA: TerB N-terminal domain-containing protein [Thermoanaerobaculia bacterium]|jgi:uncharacterized tellurite resistance protein B-like protein
MADDLALRLQMSLQRAQRLAELGRRAKETVRGLKRPRGRKAADANELWIGRGESAEVHRFATGDLVYVGSGLPALNRYGDEPSLIDPELPVAPPQQANTDGSGLSTWLSYSEIPPASRTAYLQWLAGGRRDPRVALAYVRLFFFGLERRVYEFVQDRGSSADELLSIGTELARLLKVYGSENRTGAAQALLDVIALIEPRGRSIRRPFAPAEEAGKASMRLRMALAERAVAGQPIPARLALEWLRAMHDPSVAARRCPREFELLFHIRYAQRFGDGLLLKPNKTFIQKDYGPASPGLDALTVRSPDLPDIAQLARPLDKLIALADECTAALAPFSRFVLKHGRDTLGMFALLPHELVEATHSAAATAIAELIRARIDGQGFASILLDEVLPYVRVAKPGKLAKSEAVLLAQALEKLGYGIEPDVRLGGPLYEPGTPAIVFRRLPDCPSAASEEYTAATLCMRLGAVVSAADDDVTEGERTLLRQHIEATLQLSPGERQRLAAHLAWLLAVQPGISGLKKRLAALTRDARHHLGQLLITVATTDGRVDAREMKMLEKLYALIGLDAGTLYADIHAALAPDDDPVLMEHAAAAPKGYAIPPRPVAPAPGLDIELDMERVRLKIAETRQVSTLLSSIFVEEETAVAAAPQPVAVAGTIGTLDAAHSELLRRLAERESWPREELERLAAELSLLPDGALETINDYAYATADEPLWEDDDPVAINKNVARELIA